MNNSIKDKVIELKNKVFKLWEEEGLWDPSNPNTPLYGLDQDPLMTMLFTALVYQQYQIEADIEGFRKGVVNEFEEAVLPYHLLKATPAMAMMCTAKSPGNNNRCLVGQDSDFALQKETFQSRETLHFCPLFESNIIGATLKSVAKQLDGKFKLTLEVTDNKAMLGGVGFFFKDIDFEDFTIYYNGKEVLLIRPWEYDCFPMNPDFSFWNLIYNQSLNFGTNEQWFDLWAAQNLQYYMVDPYANVILNQGEAEILLEFKGLKNKAISEGNVIINSFPVVNVTKKSFGLTLKEPIVKIADDSDFFLNLVGEYETIDEADKFILRRYGCERFGLAELLRLADELQRRNSTDYYAYQLVPALQDGEKMRKLKLLVKDIMTVLDQEGKVKSGIYAMLKEDAKINLSVPLKALYTDGAKANDIRVNAIVLAAPSELDLGQTHLLTPTQEGRDEVTDSDERKRLSHYYTLTNDKIVTRSDLKSFCIKELYKYDIDDVNRIEVANDEDGNRTVVAFVSGIGPDFDIEAVQHKLERLIEVRSSGLMLVKVMIVKGKS